MTFVPRSTARAVRAVSGQPGSAARARASQATLRSKRGLAGPEGGDEDQRLRVDGLGIRWVQIEDEIHLRRPHHSVAPGAATVPGHGGHLRRFEEAWRCADRIEPRKLDAVGIYEGRLLTLDVEVACAIRDHRPASSGVRSGPMPVSVKSSVKREIPRQDQNAEPLSCRARRTPVPLDGSLEGRDHRARPLRIIHPMPCYEARMIVDQDQRNRRAPVDVPVHEVQVPHVVRNTDASLSGVPATELGAPRASDRPASVA